MTKCVVKERRKISHSEEFQIIWVDILPKEKMITLKWQCFPVFLHRKS